MTSSHGGPAFEVFSPSESMASFVTTAPGYFFGTLSARTRRRYPHIFTIRLGV